MIDPRSPASGPGSRARNGSPSAAGGDAGGPAGGHRSGARTVLIVDDVPGFRLLLRMAIARESGLKVVGEAADGREAIDRARDLQPDLVLLDLAMPVMDGFEALPQILEASPGSRVLVLSGFEADAMESRARSLGAGGYVEKGAEPEEIIAGLIALADAPSA